MSGKVGDNTGIQSGVVTSAGAGIESLSSDPSAEHGKVWFNSTTSLLKVYNNAATWSSGGNLAAVRDNICGNNGTQTACFVSCGSDGSSNYNTTEEYNGSTWGSGGNAADQKNTVGTCGTLTAGLLWAGWTGSAQK